MDGETLLKSISEGRVRSYDMVRKGSSEWKRIGDPDRFAKSIAKVPEGKGFYFCDKDRKTSSIIYTGVYAGSLEEFLEALRKVPVSSLEYHLRAGVNDFENWSRDVLKIDALANQFREVKARGESGEALRGELISVVKRYVW
jgi:hypothetical protein